MDGDNNNHKNRDKFLRESLPISLYSRLHHNCRLLVVGAGGIGCELLKCLVQSGFTNMDVVDLDTIDVSNLNRQFLFRRHHVSMPKATVCVHYMIKRVIKTHPKGCSSSCSRILSRSRHSCTSRKHNYG